ncbi:copper resistance CopC/CopD family protein [Kutzneria chonburiensis]|uniref:Copper resistance protein CopC n=1 Tax=Kutzneria chonburiensis TaxID=1483604 RepID=A0ABV6N8F9_9PSEU|nr:copper resistance protein CopC [Kutzneria chonburiensis]
MRAVLVVLAGVLAALFASAGQAAAHAALLGTQPAPSAVVATAPSSVTLNFGEPVQVGAQGIRVLGPDGSTVDDGRAGPVDGRADTVGVAIEARAPGTYTVSWHVQSADSHPVSGAFTFSVGHATVAAATAPTGDPGVALLYWIFRVLGYVAFAGLAGSLGFLFLCWPNGSIDRRLTWGSWIALAVATVADAVLQGPYGAGLGLDHILDGGLLAVTLGIPLGTGLVLRLSLLALTAPVIADAFPRGRRTIAALLLNGLALTWSVSGHAAGPATLPADVLHLDAMALWLGGLAVILLAKPPPAAIARFSRVALASVAVLIATGLFQSWQQLSSLDTAYARLLAVKVGVVLVILYAAWFSRRWLRSAAVRRSVLVEALGAMVVLALTAALVTTDPGRPPLSPEGPLAFDTGGPHGQGRLQIGIVPGTVGPNIIAVTVTDRTGMRIDVAELDAELSMPDKGIGPMPVPIRRTGMAMGGYRAGSTELPFAGRWRLAITVRTSEFDETTVVRQVQVT